MATVSFVTGDFNVTKDSSVCDRNKRSRRYPGPCRCERGRQRTISRSPTRSTVSRVPAENGAVIDYVFVNDKVDAEKFKINPVKHSDGRYASDHVSVVATLSFK